jgi:hypothetical protein
LREDWRKGWEKKKEGYVKEKWGDRAHKEMGGDTKEFRKEGFDGVEKSLMSVF